MRNSHLFTIALLTTASFSSARRLGEGGAGGNESNFDDALAAAHSDAYDLCDGEIHCILEHVTEFVEGNPIEESPNPTSSPTGGPTSSAPDEVGLPDFDPMLIGQGANLPDLGASDPSDAALVPPPPSLEDSQGIPDFGPSDPDAVLVMENEEGIPDLGPSDASDAGLPGIPDLGPSDASDADLVPPPPALEDADDIPDLGSPPLEDPEGLPDLGPPEGPEDPVIPDLGPSDASLPSLPDLGPSSENPQDPVVPSLEDAAGLPDLPDMDNDNSLPDMGGTSDPAGLPDLPDMNNSLPDMGGTSDAALLPDALPSSPDTDGGLFPAVADGSSSSNVLPPDVIPELPDHGSSANPAISDAGGQGDPHFKTWRNEHFEYHGQCDLILALDQDFADGLGLEVQIRTKVVRYWSYIQSVAIRIGTDIFELQGNYDAGLEEEEELRYWINLEFRGPAQTLGGFPIIFQNPTGKAKKQSVVIDLSSKYPNGAPKIELQVWREFVKVNFPNPTAEAFGKTVGILGDFYTGKTVGRDGVTVLNDYMLLGEEWQVLPADNMLFHSTEEPQFPAKCMEPEESQGMRRRRRLGEVTVTEEQAEKACGHLKDHIDRKDCVYDVLATQNLDMVGAY